MELEMGTRERDRLKVMAQVAEGALGSDEGAVRLKISRRQMQRLTRAYRERGDRAALHGLRARRANNAKSEALRGEALELIAARYADYGPTLAAEELAERHGIALSRETLRRWMMGAGLWRGARKPRRHRKRRPRRPCFGELVQMDTSEHDWLEGRGEPLVLITMIDDATGLRREGFFRRDTSEANMTMIAGWIGRYGRPLALYTDWAGHFKQRQVKGKRRVRTQIERALEELGIELIAAGSPQAKGRVERSHRVDQDRLVKGLRQAGARTLEEANAYLQQVHLPRINARFAKAPARRADAHRTAEGMDLEAILCVQKKRVVARDWTVTVGAEAWQIEAGERTAGLPGQCVVVEQRRDGSVRLRRGDRYLRFRSAPPAGRALREAVDFDAPWTAGAQGRPASPQGLNNPPARSARGRVVHKLHSPDDVQSKKEEETEKKLKTPVRIVNRTRKPPPDHPWR